MSSRSAARASHVYKSPCKNAASMKSAPPYFLRCAARSRRLNLKTYVDGARRVRERADADEVDARIGVGPHVLQRDAARRFEQHVGLEAARQFDRAGRL